MFALSLVLAAASSLATQTPEPTSHEVLLQGNGRLAILATDGKVRWEMPWGGIHDIHWLENGHILTRQGGATVVEIDPASKEVVWTYDSSKSGGNEGKRVEVHAFERLDSGLTMIAESGPARLIEVDREGAIQLEIPLVVDHPGAHTDTRLVRATSTNTYLVAHEADGKVREYSRENGKVVWEFEVPLFGREAAGGHGLEAYGNRLFQALRLPSGNTLISTGNGHGVIEVTPAKKVVWQLQQDDLTDIRFAWVTTLEVLPNGHYVIGNCHAGPGQPVLVEIEPKAKAVIWTLDCFEDFGNSVSNTLLVEMAGKSLR